MIGKNVKNIKNIEKMNMNKHVKILITYLGVTLSLASPQTTQGMDYNNYEDYEQLVDLNGLGSSSSDDDADKRSRSDHSYYSDNESSESATSPHKRAKVENNDEAIQEKTCGIPLMQPLQLVQPMNQQLDTKLPWSFIQSRIIQPAVVASWERKEQYDCLLNLRLTCKRMIQSVDFIQLLWLAKKYGIVSREGIDRLRLFLTGQLHCRPDPTTKGIFYKLSNLVNPVEDTIPLRPTDRMGNFVCFMTGLRKGPIDPAIRKLEIKITLWDLFNRNEDGTATYLESLREYWNQNKTRMPFLITWTGSDFNDLDLKHYLLAAPEDVSRRTVKDNFCEPLPYRRYAPIAQMVGDDVNEVNLMMNIQEGILFICGDYSLTFGHGTDHKPQK
ncbi:MAG: hypothetical protein K2Y18_10140 [Alphaproteobacteria bacterium]|jgi:hypothetical protein|nr:hypothetical protein [Alphaproteobacteria bacterium]